VIYVENQGLWREGKAGDVLLYDGFADPINVSLAGRVFKARHRRARGQRGSVGKRQACCAELEHRVVAQAVRVVTVLVAATDLIDPLCQQVVIRVADIAGVAAIGQGSGDACGRADLEVDAAQQRRAKIG